MMIEREHKQVVFMEPVRGYNSLTVTKDSGDSIETHEQFVLILKNGRKFQVPWHNVAGIVTGDQYEEPPF